MTREEAIERIEFLKGVYSVDMETALDMAIEALQADAVSLVGTMKYLTKPHNYCEVVRCKDCRHHGMRDCPVWGDDTTEDYMWCYYGERREPLPQYAEWKDAFNKMCESAKPKTFVADEWYHNTFKEED